jgi:hypothetical protein
VNAASFNRHLTRKLCWIDGSPTHASSERQRQCSQCRRKWSYDGLAKQWILAQEYCAGSNRRQAAAAAGVDVHSAGRHYIAFERALAANVRRLIEEGKGWVLADTERLQDVLRQAMKRKGQRQKARLAARLRFEKLHVRKRLDLIFKEVFSRKLEHWLQRR